jgi:hypothetical protein
MSADSAILLRIENRVRTQTRKRLTDITNHYGAVLGAHLRTTTAISGTEVLSNPDMHRALTTILDGAQASIENTVRAAYQAGGAAARRSARTDLAQYRYTVPEKTNDDGDYLIAILASVSLAFAVALTDIQDSVRAAYDAITGPAAAATRILATHAAIDRAIRRLGVRVVAGAVVAVHRGYTDTQNTIYRTYNDAHPSVKLNKQWRTTSTHPCPACKALDGATVAIDAEFDRTATTDPDHRPPPVFRNLLGPPRHPNCRCRLIYVATPATQALRTQVTAPSRAPLPTRLTAAQVRQMPRTRYNALIAFFTAAARRISRLLHKVRSGG